jgi:hypothetical protein
LVEEPEVSYEAAQVLWEMAACGDFPVPASIAKRLGRKALAKPKKNPDVKLLALGAKLWAGHS